LQNNLFKEENYIKEVREQYENYPYPPRNPEDEKKHFNYVSFASLEFLNHYHYEGKRDFSKGFRALIAGGGTGDALVTLAEQCRDMDVDIVYLDISSASMNVAKERMKVRGLEDKINWIQGSLLDSSELFEDKFDYINCSGVLHHLESPEKGLAALSSVLKDDGVIAIMVYARYGREGIYQMQDLMKILNKDEANLQQKVDNCKSVLNSLPKTNGYMDINNMFIDIKEFGDNGIYDLFLHSNDVAYTVPQLYEYVRGSNLDITHFCHTDKNKYGNNLYNIEAYIGDKHLLGLLKNMKLEEKQAAAELIHGKIPKHCFFASKIKPKVPATKNHDNVPYLSMIMSKDSYACMYNLVKSHSVGAHVALEVFGFGIRFQKTKNLEYIFKYFDGKKTIGQIFTQIRKEYPNNVKKPSNDELQIEFDKMYESFSLYDWIFLKDKKIPQLYDAAAIQKRLQDS
jgi:SAM-dependent methyltransferase